MTPLLRPWKWKSGAGTDRIVVLWRGQALKARKIKRELEMQAKAQNAGELEAALAAAEARLNDAAHEKARTLLVLEAYKAARAWRRIKAKDGRFYW